ncbi:MAG: hypothetical protein LLG00_17120 [Planctomycetaceae bacterium]|nr:hypothetical protein [Planctomycetaceae bacterium]
MSCSYIAARRAVAASLLGVFALLISSGSPAGADPQAIKPVGKVPQNFKDVPGPAAALIGLAVTIDPTSPSETVITGLQPQYLTAKGTRLVGRKVGRTSPNAIEAVAKDGYAVGAILVKAGDQLNGFRLVFMRLKGDRLDPNDNYQSRWFGGCDGGAEKRLGGDGRPIIGICGREHDRIASLEVIQRNLPDMKESKSGGASLPQAKKKVVYLERSRDFSLATRYHRFHDLLSEELLRQAFLLAAREEVGLATRDARLGDAMPTEGECPPWEVSIPASQTPLIEVLQGFYPRQAAMASREVDAYDGKIDYLKQMDGLEQRSRDLFCNALRRAGFQDEPRRPRSDASVPDDVAGMLEEMTFVPQFEAVRRLHQLIRDRGESPQLAGALVRGYANLGILTELHAHPAHNAFKARALLYAQRLVVQEKGAARSRQHRAYALAAATLNSAALQDLATAEKQLKDKTTAGHSQERSPDWAKVIDAYCRYDIKTLESLEKDKHLKMLAAVLAFRDLEMSDCEEMAIEKAEQVLKATPECCRIIDGLSGMGGVGLMHRSTLIGIAAVRKTLYGRLAEIPGLPAEVAAIARKRAKVVDESADEVDLVDEFKGRAEIVVALVDSASKPAKVMAEKEPTKAAGAAESGEPSWATLGGLIREQALIQGWRRVHFESYLWGVSPNRTLAAIAPILAGHPYRALVETASWDKKTQADAIQRISGISAMDFEGHFYTLLLETQNDTDCCRRLFGEGAEHFSHTERGFMQAMPLLTPRTRVELARAVLVLSPYCPSAKTLLIEHDWDHVKDRATEWEMAGERFPAILQALGSHYAKAGRYADSERCLRAAVDIMPTYAGYVMLADTYKKQNKMQEWKSTLEEYLNHPDYGLSHAMVCAEIARYHMARDEWKKALPYAEGAAECYSAWGLLTAAECHEALHHWKEAETLYRAESERYSGNWRFSWYLFCVRTGHGDIKAARHLTLGSMTPESEHPADGQQDSSVPRAFYYLLENQSEKAMTALDRVFQTGSEPAIGVVAALLHKELKDDANAIATLRQIASRNSKSRRSDPKIAVITGLAELMAAEMEKGGPSRIDVSASPLIKEADSLRNPIFFYCLGKYHAMNGNKDQAIACWRKAATYSFGKKMLVCAMARVVLRQHGVDLDADDPPKSPSKTKPEAGKPKAEPAEK